MFLLISSPEIILEAPVETPCSDADSHEYDNSDDSGEFSDFGEYDKTGDSGESNDLLDFQNSGGSSESGYSSECDYGKSDDCCESND